jgi:hypothetical protein
MEIIPHCIGATKSESELKRFKAGQDSICVPVEFDGTVHSVESLRCLFVAYMFLILWLQWDPFISSHGSHVAKVLGVDGVNPDGLPGAMIVLGEDRILNVSEL